MSPVWALLALAGTAGAHAAPDLYVSSDIFGGPMILEIVASGGPPGEPEVSLDGEALKMVRGAGGWYAYVADTGAARVMDAATGIPGTGLDFGIECGPGFLGESSGSDAVFTSGDSCGIDVSPGYLHVLNGAPATSGPDSLDPDHWPFIQTFELDGEMRITYGGLQKTVLYDGALGDEARIMGGASGGDVLVMIHDPLLNVDPTMEDTWTFDVEGGEVYSCIFDETGRIADINGTIVEVDPDLIYHYGDSMRAAGFAGGAMTAEPRGAAVVRDNALQDSTLLPSIAGSLVTLRETAPSSGVFTNVDRTGAANMRAGPGFDVRYGPAALEVGVESPVAVLGPRTDPGIVAGRQAVAEGGILNLSGMGARLTHVIEVVGQDGSAVSISRMSGYVSAGGMMTHGASWVPQEPGEYTVVASVPGYQGAQRMLVVTAG